MADLKSVLNDMDSDNRILLLYTDGGPDHRHTYLSVQLCLVAVFINLELDVDFLCAVRTPPKHSWKNPVERIMSIINLGLQGIGLMRQEVVHEAEFKRCGSLKSIRTMADKVPGMKEEVIQSVEPTMELLSSFMQRLRLKEHRFKTYSTASEDKMTNLWNSVLEVDASLTKDDRTKQHLKRKDQLKGFLDIHCRVRQYMFSILKCQSPECTVCKAPRLPPDVFQQIQHLPDPVPTGNRYQAFDDLYGKVETTEEYLPSKKVAAPKGIGCPFNPSAQTAKNVGVVTQCEECDKWRCLHAQRKLKEKAREELEILMENVLYSCGSVLKDIDNEGDDTSVLSDFHVRANLNCNTPIELSYYTAGYELICYYCGAVDDLVEQDGYYPQCNNCGPKDKVSGVAKTFTQEIDFRIFGPCILLDVLKFDV